MVIVCLVGEKDCRGCVVAGLVVVRIVLVFNISVFIFFAVTLVVAIISGVFGFSVIVVGSFIGVVGSFIGVVGGFIGVVGSFIGVVFVATTKCAVVEAVGIFVALETSRLAIVVFGCWVVINSAVVGFVVVGCGATVVVERRPTEGLF